MIRPEMQKLLEYYNQGLQKYKEADFKKALGLFEKALTFVPEDGPTLMYIKRCKEYIQDPPPADWDGVYIMKTK